MRQGQARRRQLIALLALAGVVVLVAVVLLGRRRADQRWVPLLDLAITGAVAPLRPDGWVDYRAAWNELATRGAPERNAARAVLRALGPQLQQFLNTDQLEELGVAVPTGAERLIPFSFWLDRYRGGDPDPASLAESPSYEERLRPVEPGHAQLEEGVERPWKPAQFPELSAYLKEMTSWVDEFVVASQLDYFHVPEVGPGIFRHPGQWSKALWWELSPLVARGMLRAGQGTFEAATADAVALLRLGRLLVDHHDLDVISAGMYLIEDGLKIASYVLDTPGGAVVARDLENELKGLCDLSLDRALYAERLQVLAGLSRTIRDIQLANRTISWWKPSFTLDIEYGLRRINAAFDELQRLVPLGRDPCKSWRRALEALGPPNRKEIRGRLQYRWMKTREVARANIDPFFELDLSISFQDQGQFLDILEEMLEHVRSVEGKIEDFNDKRDGP